MKNYLDKSLPKCREALNEQPDCSNYNNILNVTLTSVILFNKRRSGEASRMLIESYHHGRATQSGLICTRLKLVDIQGKRNRTVPVLLTPDVVTAVDCLLQKRNEVGVDEANPYVFARCSRLNSVDGHTCIRRVVSSVKLDRPDLITSTYLRKYIATVSQLQDMKQNKFELLCQHMGHTASVHQDYYRLPSHTLELVKLSKLLLAVENGNLIALCGKNLDELNIQEIPDENDDNDGDASASDTEPEREVAYPESTSSKMVLSNTHRRAKKRKNSQQENEDTRVHGVEQNSKPVARGTNMSDVKPDSEVSDSEPTSSKMVLNTTH